MKKLTLLLFVVFSANVFSAEIKLSDIKEHLVKQNLEVQANAERIYQSKLQIQLARRNLLPRLNLSKVISTALTLTGAIGLIEDIAPFLFPANWIKIKETRALAAASERSFEALKLNQIFSGRSSALTVFADEFILSEINEQETTLASWIDLIRLQERLGRLPPGTSSDFERLKLEAERDSYLQRQNVAGGLSEMKMLLNIPQTETLHILGSLDEVSEGNQSIDPNWAEKTPETQSFDSLIEAAYQYKRGFFFSFLGFTSNASGLSGGVFDGLPQPNGLGFGMGPSMQIASRQIDMLELQREGTIQTQKKALVQTEITMGTLKSISKNVIERENKIEESLLIMSRQAQIGLPMDTNRLFELLRDRLSTRVEHTLTRLNLALSVERKNRILNLDQYLEAR